MDLNFDFVSQYLVVLTWRQRPLVFLWIASPVFFFAKSHMPQITVYFFALWPETTKGQSGDVYSHFSSWLSESLLFTPQQILIHYVFETAMLIVAINFKLGIIP